LIRSLPRIVFSALILSGLALAQDSPARSLVSQPEAASAPEASPTPSAVVSTPAATSLSGSSSSGSSSPSSPSSSAAFTPSGKRTQPDENAAEATLDPASLLPDLPSLPRAKATLIGGTIAKLDRIQDQLTLQVFGGRKMKIAFDTRTRIYLDGVLGSAADLKPGARAYVDTVLNNGAVFARNIRLKTGAPAGESRGVVLAYRADNGELTVRDRLSPEPLKVRLTASTRLVQGDHAASTGDLQPGTLVDLKFDAQLGGHDVVDQVSVLAVPGTSFTFAGQVIGLDLHRALLVLDSSTDHKTYEISLDPSLTIDDNLHIGAVVTAIANFDGSRYLAHSLSVISK